MLRHLIALGLLTLTAAAAEPRFRIDNLPMYGQPKIERPERLKKADAAFIKKVTKGFKGDLKAASLAWCQQADSFLNRRNFDLAMRRYNQAWLLDPSSFWPYWGFARVAIEQDRFAQAIDLLEEALKHCDDKLQKPALLSDTATGYSHYARYEPHLDETQRTAAFDRANALFLESTTLDPNYGGAWKRWAMSLHRQGRYAEAWEKVHRAQKIPDANVPTDFIEALTKQMPEPR